MTVCVFRCMLSASVETDFGATATKSVSTLADVETDFVAVAPVLDVSNALTANPDVVGRAHAG